MYASFSDTLCMHMMHVILCMRDYFCGLSARWYALLKLPLVEDGWSTAMQRMALLVMVTGVYADEQHCEWLIEEGLHNIVLKSLFTYHLWKSKTY